MPMYQFRCNSCGASFEKLVRKGNPTAIPCIACGAEALRGVSDFGFAFGDGKTDGNTGVHSLDTDLDKRIGRDAQESWEKYKDRFTRKRQVQRESGNEAGVPVKIEGGDYVPMNKKEVERFRLMHGSYGKMLGEHRKEREARGVGQHDDDPKPS